MTNKVNVVELAAELVRIPSVNPMGRAISPQIAGEGRVTNWLERFFASLDVPSRRYLVRDDGDGLLRENIVARFEGSPSLDEGGVLVMLEAHQDTVPIDGMSIDPFAAQQENGRLFGRGACDIKGGMACLLTTAVRMYHNNAPRPTILVACTVNEEFGFCGAKQLAALIDGGGDELIPRRPDAIIVAEPTELNVVTSHKGMIRWVCETLGKAGHSSEPTSGTNAIYRMAPILSALEQFAGQLNERAADPLLGKPTLSVGTVKGGISVNTIPDRCRIEIDRRLLPNEDQLAARDEVIAAVGVAGSEFVRHHPPFTTSPGLTAENNGALAARLQAIAAQHAPGREIVGVPYGTDAAFMAQCKIPTVVFGPGSIGQAHTVDEWVDVRQLDLCVEILMEFARGFAKE